MFVECVKRSDGVPYLRVAQTYSETKGGVSKVKKRIIKSIGPLHRYDDGQPDYIGRLKRSFKEGAPLIEALAELASDNKNRDAVTLRFDRRSAETAYSNPKNTGYFLLDGLYDALGIYDVLNLRKSRQHLDYDLNGNAKLLAFGRVLAPASKFATHSEKGNYLFPVSKSENVKDIYKTLSELDKASEAIQNMRDILPRIQPAVCHDYHTPELHIVNRLFHRGAQGGRIGVVARE
jgi:triphosphoribosyl-dephospho-CoA synthetase